METNAPHSEDVSWFAKQCVGCRRKLDITSLVHEMYPGPSGAIYGVRGGQMNEYNFPSVWGMSWPDRCCVGCRSNADIWT